MKHSADVDPGVLERARAGDREAFVTLVRVHDPRLRALAFRLLGTSERMDDALQEAYLSAFQSLPRFRAGSAFGTWLYRIAYNACLDELRRARSAHLLSLEEVDERADGPFDLADAASGRAEIARALAALAPADRAAVFLVDAHGFDYVTAAEVLDVPVGTIASRLNRARRRLRQVLEEPMEGAVER